MKTILMANLNRMATVVIGSVVFGLLLAFAYVFAN